MRRVIVAGIRFSIAEWRWTTFLFLNNFLFNFYKTNFLTIQNTNSSQNLFGLIFVCIFCAGLHFGLGGWKLCVLILIFDDFLLFNLHWFVRLRWGWRDRFDGAGWRRYWFLLHCLHHRGRLYWLGFDCRRDIRTFHQTYRCIVHWNSNSMCQAASF